MKKDSVSPRLALAEAEEFSSVQDRAVAGAILFYIIFTLIGLLSA